MIQTIPVKLSLIKLLDALRGGAGGVWQKLFLPVGMPLVLDYQVLLMDGLQQSSSQRLEVRDGLRSGRQAAALLLQEHLLDWNFYFGVKNNRVGTDKSGIIKKIKATFSQKDTNKTYKYSSTVQIDIRVTESERGKQHDRSKTEMERWKQLSTRWHFPNFNSRNPLCCFCQGLSVIMAASFPCQWCSPPPRTQLKTQLVSLWWLRVLQKYINKLQNNSVRQLKTKKLICFTDDNQLFFFNPNRGSYRFQWKCSFKFNEDLKWAQQFVFPPCLADSTPVRGQVFDLPYAPEFFLLSRAVCGRKNKVSLMNAQSRESAFHKNIKRFWKFPRVRVQHVVLTLHVYLVLHDVRFQQAHLLLQLSETLVQIPTIRMVRNKISVKTQMIRCTLYAKHDNLFIREVLNLGLGSFRKIRHTQNKDRILLLMRSKSTYMSRNNILQ